MIDNSSNRERYFYHDGNTKIGYNTLCTFYPTEDLGFIIIVNDTISQGKVGDLKNNIKKALDKK
jgi:serine-type D-Ala-D-Ala carboxypeptidase/endopeptidase